MRRLSSRLLPLALVASLAAIPSAGAAAAPPAPAGTALEKALLADAADRALDDFSLLEAGLIVSGVKDRAELEAARTWYEGRLRPVTGSLKRGPPRDRAQRLLGLLHQGTGRAPALLRSYDLEATSLLEVMDDGTFNCVSATLLYVLASRELGLEVHAVLLPSHARAAFVHGGATEIVETTVAQGFGARPEASREIVRRLQSGADANAIELYTDERGLAVDDLALLGAIYTNRSVAAKQRGDLVTAQALEARADRLVDAAARPLLRRVRTSTLLQLATQRYREGKLEAAAELCQQALKLGLTGAEAKVARHNLAALTSMRLAQLAEQDDEPAVLAFAERFGRKEDGSAELRAATWAALGAIRNRRGDAAGSAAAYREAALAGASTSNAQVHAHNRVLAELRRVVELVEKDPETAWTLLQAIELPPGEQKLAADKTDLATQVALRRAHRLVQLRRCAEADRRLAEWTSLKPGARADPLRAECRGRVGMERWEAKDFDAAGKAFREAMRLNPSEPAFRNNLVAVLQRQINPLVEANRCADAAPLLAEGRALVGEDPFFRKAAELCARRGGR